MAQFDFYGTWEDSLTFLETLVRLDRFTFVVDMWYTEPVPFQFKTLTDEVVAVVRKRTRVYLWADEYSRFPPYFGEPTDELWMINPTHGGPALDLSLPACFEREGKLCLASGNLFYQPQYCNPETGEWYKPPEALKRAYYEVRALLRKGMVKRYVRSRTVVNGAIKPTIEPLWIGPNAMALLEKSEAGILIDGWQTGTDLRKIRSELEPLIDEYEE